MPVRTSVTVAVNSVSVKVEGLREEKLTREARRKATGAFRQHVRRPVPHSRFRLLEDTPDVYAFMLQLQPGDPPARRVGPLLIRQAPLFWAKWSEERRQKSERRRAVSTHGRKRQTAQ